MHVYASYIFIDLYFISYLIHVYIEHHILTTLPYNMYHTYIQLVQKSVALQRASEDGRVSLEGKLKLYIEANEGLQDRLRECTGEIHRYIGTLIVCISYVPMILFIYS